MKDPKDLRYEIAACRSEAALNELRDANLDYLNSHQYLFRVISDHRKLLSNIRRMKFAYTPVSEMN